MKGFRLWVIILTSNVVCILATALVSYLLWSSGHEGPAEPEAISHRIATDCCPCPTTTLSPTEPPTESPTTQPPSSNGTIAVYHCPQDEEESLELHLTNNGGEPVPIELDIPNDGLCTLTLVSSDGFFKPVARSYNGHDWEASAGDFASLDVSCSTDRRCRVELPQQHDATYYALTKFSTPVLHNGRNDEIARFLEQATFGPTRTAIDYIIASQNSPSDGLGLVFADWIQQQQHQAPISSHRAIYRRFLNARMEVATRQGAVTHPCQQNTRYRKYAFSNKDRGKFVDIVTFGNKKLLKVDGFVRTVVEGPIVSRWDDSIVFADGAYEIRRFSEESNFLEGALYLYHPELARTYPVKINGVLGNPSIHFEAGVTPNVLLSLDSLAAAPVDTQYFQHEPIEVQELILTADLDDPLCESLGPPGNPLNPVFALYEGDYWIHDPRFDTIENTMESPAVDGGGSIVRATKNIIQPDLEAKCSNVRRNFLNEEHCYLSYDPTACSSRISELEDHRPDFWLELSPETLRDIYVVTGNGTTPTTRYLYAIEGLRVNEDADVPPPCDRTKSRWIPIACTGSASSDQINEMFGTMLSRSGDENPNVRDIWNWWGEPCPASFAQTKGFEVQDLDGNCWRHVHSDHLSVYDMTSWTQDHPGGAAAIEQFAVAGGTVLSFPGWHTMARWASNERQFGQAGRLGDRVHYYDLPSELRSRVLSDFFGFTANSIQYEDSNGVLVCGSPYEVENDPILGGSQGRGAFDSFNRYFATTSTDDFAVQKRAIWTKAVFEAEDQLRQRVAWALAQILVVSTDAIDEGERTTEPSVTYYDIFVRNAFGNYFDVLKEVSYSPLMAQMLTYYQSQSTAYIWDRYQNLEYADENYAREIMQLFTTGLFRLNMDGTRVLGQNGDPARVYTNDDIMEYARVWTGFVSEEDRGNFESSDRLNSVDPMKIEMKYRDVFPKMGLDRRYIGDGYPLCADLPSQHFLKKGATYRLLGKTPAPELVSDPDEWVSEALAERLVLQANGQDSLFAKLCGSVNVADCSYPSKVVLDETLPCSGYECSVDTTRVVEVGDGVFYEYTRPPCVHQAFFDDAKLVLRRGSWRHLVCADPRTDVASAACCDGNSGFWNDVYWGERITFATAQQRCSGMDLCNRWPRPTCDSHDPTIGSYCENDGRFWTETNCQLQVKIDENGHVAILHSPEIPGLDHDDISYLVRPDDAKTFFRVDWSDLASVDEVFANCESVSPCSRTSDGMCMCAVAVSEEQVFADGDNPSSEDVLNMLHIGAFEPSTGSGALIVEQIGEDVIVHKENGVLTTSSVYEVMDKGVRVFRKNIRSTIQIVGSDLSFRNPVHFISLSDPELRDAHDETDAALRHYFYHDNTAPFLALRFSQRFGISNPSPRYIQEIATAFTTGSYTYLEGAATVSFGSGKYGCLAATIACVLLDREARSVVLDADPSYGSMKEPLLKTIGLMKALEFQLNDDVDFLHFDIDTGLKMGQMAHDIPNVFSFFLPEYAASGPVTQGSLVSPEAQVLTGPRLINSLNGYSSLVKYGFSECFGGLAPISNPWEAPDCNEYVAGLTYENEGVLGQNTFTPLDGRQSEAIVDELATLLTGGRLSLASRELIDDVVTQETNLRLKFIKAQQLIVAAPEFHVTNVVRRTDALRPEPETPPPSSNPYKAVVYVLLDGGADTFNMLVPHSCSQTNSDGLTLLQQYYDERTSIAMAENERSRVIDATDQPCSEFAIHEELEIVERLYNQGDLSFFANAGVINRPATKETYMDVTKTQLFAHNAMQEEAQKIDPFDGSPGTGVLGRMCDVLKTKGFNAKPITIEDATVATVGVPGSAVDPLFVTTYEANKFLPRPDSEIFDARPYVDQLNGETKTQSSVFAETYSARLQKAVHDNEALAEALDNTQLNGVFEDTDYSQKLQRVSTLIASQRQRGSDRDVFYLSLGGWDHHANLKNSLASNFEELNEALTSFYDEMTSQGMWDNVTLVITSDFGRTLTANSGEGSDHAWGGNYFAMGGAVRGGTIHGDYPADITASGPLNIGRGRLIPTMSWESIFNSIVEWMGADTEDDKDYCLPNRIQTGTRLFTKEEVFV